jgi:hypothetical protein
MKYELYIEFYFVLGIQIGKFRNRSKFKYKCDKAIKLKRGGPHKKTISLKSVPFGIETNAAERTKFTQTKSSGRTEIELQKLNYNRSNY